MIDGERLGEGTACDVGDCAAFQIFPFRDISKRASMAIKRFANAKPPIHNCTPGRELGKKTMTPYGFDLPCAGRRLGSSRRAILQSEAVRWPICRAGRELAGRRVSPCGSGPDNMTAGAV